MNGQPDKVPFDRDAILASLEGDRELLWELVGLFRRQVQTLLPEIRSAGDRRDGNALERAAHKLKSSLGSFAADKASAAALRLELMGRSGDFTSPDLICAELESEVERLEAALSAWEKECVP
jgi:two-component system sensor histidine kinase/response regulator